MRVLLLTYQVAGRGGSYMRFTSLARHLAALGHEVTLLASRSRPGVTPKSQGIEGVRQIEMPDLAPRRVRHGGLSPFDVWFRCLWILLAERFDVIHTSEHRPAVVLPGLIGRHARGARLVSDWADLWGREGIAAERKPLLRETLGRADEYFETRYRTWVDGATAITSDIVRRLDGLGFPAEKRILLPPGANLDVIRPEEKPRVRRDLGLPVDRAIVAFSGYAAYDEPFTTRVLQELLRKDRDLLLISSGKPWKDAAHRLSRENLGDRLIQFGSLSLAENGRMLGAADVLLLPYLDKPVNRGRFPNKFGDFVAAGRPMVTHHTGDLGAMVAAHQIGVLAPETPVEFAEAVLDLLQDPTRAAVLGNRARVFAEEVLGWPTLARTVETLYLSLLASA